MLFDKETYWNRRNNTVKVKVPDGDKKKKDGTPAMKTVSVPQPLRGQVIAEPEVKVLKEGKGTSFRGRILAMNRKFFRDNKRNK